MSENVALNTFHKVLNKFILNFFLSSTYRKFVRLYILKTHYLQFKTLYYEHFLRSLNILRNTIILAA